MLELLLKSEEENELENNLCIILIDSSSHQQSYNTIKKFFLNGGRDS